MSEQTVLDNPGTENKSTPPPPAERIKPYTPAEIAVSVCAIGIILSYFGPWCYSLDAELSIAQFFHFDALGLFLWAGPALALITLAFRRNKPLRHSLGTVTSIISAVCIIYFSFHAGNFGGTGILWGKALAVVSTFGLFAFSGERRMATQVDLIAKKLGSRKGEVYSHCCSVMKNLHFSAHEFYGTLETAIRAKLWPGAQILRVGYSEAGLLSHKREYLRIIRQRQVFDICAATFGKDYFFSVREAEIPAVVDVRAFLALLVGISLLSLYFIQILGFTMGLPALAFLLIFIVWFLFNVLKLGLTRVDSALIQLPVIGPIYEAWFRRDTYFQQDTKFVFLQSVNALVKEHVEEATSAKGLEYLDLFEKQPILGDLYKRSRIPLSGDSKPEA